MSGLGDALQMVGGSLMDMGKEKRLEKMRQEQDARAEERDKRKEERAYQRELKKAQGEPRVVDRGGKKVMQYRNSEGTVVREEEVDAYTLEQLGRQDQKEKLGLDELLQKVELGGKKLRDYDTDKALDRRYDEARIAERLAARDENVAQAGAAGRKGLEGTLTNEQEASVGNLTNMLVKETADLKEQYTGGDDPVMTAAEYRDIASKVIIEAGKRGVDPRLSFQNALRGYEAKRAQKRKERGLQD